MEGIAILRLNSFIVMGLIRCCVFVCVISREKETHSERMCVNVCLHSHNSVCMCTYGYVHILCFSMCGIVRVRKMVT